MLIPSTLSQTLLLWFSLIPLAYSQGFEGKSFTFLNIPTSARTVGLGGENITSGQRDPNVFLSNPGLLSQEVSNFISLNYTPYFSGTNYLNTVFTREIGKTGVWGAGINYLDYGKIEGYDETGEYQGEFAAKDYAIVISNSQIKNNFSVGGTIKLAGSAIANFTSSAILFDMGGTFIHPSKDLRIGMVIKNLGFALKEYTSSSDFLMPLNVQVGASFKPEFMPLRFSVTVHSLNKFKVSEESPDVKIGAIDQIFRHFVFGTEVILGKNINLRAGYNHLRRKELKGALGGGLAGFSIGMMVRVKSFEIAYSRGMFNSAGAQNCFSLIADLNYFLKNK